MADDKLVETTHDWVISTIDGQSHSLPFTDKEATQFLIKIDNEKFFELSPEYFINTSQIKSFSKIYDV